MNWKDTFVEEYAGHPVRVAINLFIVGAGGVLVGHYLLGAPLDGRLVMGAMLPALALVLAAGWLKAQLPRRRR